MEDGVCHSGYYWTGPLAKKMYSVFAISTFFTFYVIPVTCFLVLYGLVVLRMRHRKNNSDFQSNRYQTSLNRGYNVTSYLVPCCFQGGGVWSQVDGTHYPPLALEPKISG